MLLNSFEAGQSTGLVLAKNSGLELCGSEWTGARIQQHDIDRTLARVKC
jgi:hypothetical protein